MVDDAELLRNYAEDKSEAAFAVLVERHLDLVYSAALRRLAGDAHAAADVTQQVFVALARRARSLTPGVVLPAWLYATTRNVAVDFIRAERRRRAREHEAHTMHELESNPPPSGDWERLRPMLDEVMDDLSDRDREAVLLRFFARRSFAEIGAALRLSEDAARMRVERALDKLQVLLARRGVNSTSVALAGTLTAQAASSAPTGLASSVSGMAFANGGGLVGTTMNLLQIMSIAKISGAAAGVILFLTMSFSVRDALATREVQGEVADLVANRDAWRETVERLREQFAAAEQKGAGLKAALELARQEESTTQPGAQAVQASGPAPIDPVAAGQAFMAEHPEVKRTLFDWSRAILANKYDAHYKSLGLSAARIEQFEILIMAGVGMETSGFDRPPMFLAGAYDGVAVDKDDRLRQVLGAGGYAQFQEFERTAEVRQMMHHLASGLYFTATPLTAEQSNQLFGILTVERMGGVGQADQRDWDAVLMKAGAILSEPQLALLRGFRDREEFNRAMNLARGHGPLPGSPGGTAARPAPSR